MSTGQAERSCVGKSVCSFYKDMFIHIAGVFYVCVSQWFCWVVVFKKVIVLWGNEDT